MIHRLLYYLKLYKAYRIAKKFYREYEHLDRDIAFHPDMDVRLDVYSQPGGSHHLALLFVRGGAWGAFHKELFAPAAMKLLPEGMVVVIPDHTPYPQAGYEQMAHQAAAALSWTLENIKQYGGDPGRVVVAGHSSGAHLAGLAVMDPRFLEAYGHTKDEIHRVIYVSGGYDLQAQYAYEQTRSGGKDTKLMKTMVGLSGGVEHFPQASPISYVQRDLPPALILHGSQDQTVPVEIAQDFYAALQQAGAPSQLKIYPGRGHSEMLFSALTEERPELVVDISDFVHGRH